VQIPADALCPAGITMPPFHPAPEPPEASASVIVNVHVGDGSSQSPAAVSLFRGIGVTMDFWPPSKSKWSVSSTGGCGALDSDLDHPDLVYLAGQLAGSLLRLGGSPVDMLLYETPQTPLACTDVEVNKTRPSPTGGYYCPIWDHVDYTKSTGAHCLKAERWASINAFALKTGLRIAFGMNACWLRPNASGELDWTYIDAMLNQTAMLAVKNLSAVWAWEFGNELYSSGVKADRYGLDVKELMRRSDAAWGAAESAAGLPTGHLSRPAFVGPDNGLGYMSSSYVSELLAAAEGRVHAITFHDYGNPCSGSMPVGTGLALNVSCVDQRSALAVSSYAAQAAAGGAELWLGEGAFHASSGVRGLTDTFRSSLWYAQKLGSLLSTGVSMFARQTLLGGDYELVNRTTAAPTPDYYVLLLWHRLVGDAPLALDAGDALIAAPGLRLFAFKAAPGRTGATVVAMNAHMDLAVNLRLDVADVSVYQLSGDPASNRIFFNFAFGGSELVYRPGGDGLPELQPHQLGSNTVDLPPCSVSFILLDSDVTTGVHIA